MSTTLRFWFLAIAFVVVASRLSPATNDGATHMVAAVQARNRGDLEKAEAEYRGAIDAWEGSPGEEPRLANALIDLAGLYRDKKNYPDAEPLYERALSLRTRFQGAEELPVAAALDEMAAFYEVQHKYEEAIPLRRRAMDNWQKIFGKDPALGHELTLLGRDYANRKDYASAEVQYREALAILVASLGPNHSILIGATKSYARVLRELGREDAAAEQDSRAASIQNETNVLLVGGPVTTPALIHRLSPAYTQEAREARVEGVVTIYLEVGTDGKGRNLVALRHLGFGLEDKAIEAVSKWRFRPATKDGQPVTVSAIVTVNFWFI